MATPQQEGYEAFEAGLGIDDCPYAPPTWKGKQWRAGFERAKAKKAENEIAQNKRVRLITALALALYVVNLFYFVEPLTAFIDWASTALTAKEMLGAVGTLVASFAGAWFAFRFARYQRERERTDTEVAAGNRALFSLTVMYNALRQHQKEIVEPYRDRHDAYLNLHVSQPLPKVSFEMKELTFLMQVDAKTFQELLLEEERFRFAAYLIEQHRTLVLSQVWPRWEAAGLKIGDNRPEGEVEAILGPAIVQQLKVTTRAIITNFDENVKSSLQVFKKLRARLKLMYPNRKFVDFNI
jgi:hypothetical protein